MHCKSQWFFTWPCVIPWKFLYSSAKWFWFGNSAQQQGSGNCRFLQFVGPSCGHHASYTFYKAAKYLNKNGQTKILSLGEFFFVKIWQDSDIISIGELQLLWEDKNSNQILTSLRLYFLPEYTPDGRMHFHGEVRPKNLISKILVGSIKSLMGSLFSTLLVTRLFFNLGD